MKTAKSYCQSVTLSCPQVLDPILGACTPAYFYFVVIIVQFMKENPKVGQGGGGCGHRLTGSGCVRHLGAVSEALSVVFRHIIQVEMICWSVLRRITAEQRRRRSASLGSREQVCMTICERHALQYNQ